MPPLCLRPPTEADLELSYAITEEAMRGYVEQTWGRWDDAEQRHKHRDNFTPWTHRMLLNGDAVAGFVAVEDLPDYVWLVKLYLLADHRGQGLGSQVLCDVLQEARAAGKPVRLRVLRVNVRAQRLYARHGFEVIEESAERLVMQRQA